MELKVKKLFEGIKLIFLLVYTKDFATHHPRYFVTGAALRCRSS